MLSSRHELLIIMPVMQILAFIIAGTCAGLATGDEVLKEKDNWSTIDFAYATEGDRLQALADGSYVPENVIPNGISVWTNKMVFMSMPRRKKSGIPATLAYFSYDDLSTSPKLIPYPSFKDNNVSDCNNIISVNRGHRIDKYDRLWVLDYGKIGKGKDAEQLCPPRIHIFDLNTSKKILMYTLKPTDYFPSSIFTSIVVDSGSSSDDCWLYAADQIGIIVYSLKDNDSWRFDHPYCWPDPISGDFNVAGLNFQWSKAGVYGLALSPLNSEGYKTLYFHPLAGFREFSVSTKILQDKNKVNGNYHNFKKVGSREQPGHVSTQVMTRNTGILFFNLIDKNALGCWNSNMPYKKDNLAIVAKDDEKMVFLSDTIIDGNDNLWTLSNRLPEYLNDKMDFTKTNFRIFSAPVNDLVFNTACEPFLTSSPKMTSAIEN
ncbi:hypothetical protein J6590_072913 [Homalodisca vitripennis]|nr:hypothetical protein J6590_072913 [Homalodisca vitripennis]